eukprot:CAMPEP_0114994880 /NCGR_PEP_ID=MMETSP0216-20121206/13396_1 /TAXON_ID=223996 /ORGANISM="Protocruzia adherens, Strain Boccale" /LENGTH=62 /DNA_ID=CAMNT_0002358813 /DNA_START=332 /DNA_END=520 /DNA_ORIENTATION=-
MWLDLSDGRWASSEPRRLAIKRKVWFVSVVVVGVVGVGVMSSFPIVRLADIVVVGSVDFPRR